MRKNTVLEVGDRVRVRQSSGMGKTKSLGPTVYQVTEVGPALPRHDQRGQT